MDDDEYEASQHRNLAALDAIAADLEAQSEPTMLGTLTEVVLKRTKNLHNQPTNAHPNM